MSDDEGVRAAGVEFWNTADMEEVFLALGHYVLNDGYDKALRNRADIAEHNLKELRKECDELRTSLNNAVHDVKMARATAVENSRRLNQVLVLAEALAERS